MLILCWRISASTLLTSFKHFLQHEKEDSLALPPHNSTEELHQTVSEHNMPLLSQFFTTNGYNGLPFAPDDSIIQNSDSKHDSNILDKAGYDVGQTSLSNNVLGSDTPKDVGGSYSDSISGVDAHVEKAMEETEVRFCVFHYLDIRISLSDISVSCISHFRPTVIQMKTTDSHSHELSQWTKSLSRGRLRHRSMHSLN